MAEVQAETNGHKATGYPAALAGLQIDPDKLKLREHDEIEAFLTQRRGERVSLVAEWRSGSPPADVVIAGVWAHLRRTNPDATFEDAGEFDYTEIQAAVAATEALEAADVPVDPPTAPSGDATGSRSTGSASSRRSRTSAGTTG